MHCVYNVKQKRFEAATSTQQQLVNPVRHFFKQKQQHQQTRTLKQQLELTICFSEWPML